MPIFYDLTHAEYERLPGWRWSHIKLLENASPRAVRHAVDTPSEDTTAYAKLRAIHAAVLEPHRFGDQFVRWDGDRRSKAYKDFAAANTERGILTVTEWDDVFRVAEAVRAHPVARELLSAGASEVSVTWTDPATGLPCKGRVDWLCADGSVVDLKTCGTVHERGVASLVARNLWHGQLAHYCAGLAENGKPAPAAYIIAAEGKGAQDVAVYQIDRGIPDGALHVGEGIRSRLMQRLAACVHHDSWPGRHPGIETLCLPTYALDDVEITADAIVG